MCPVKSRNGNNPRATEQSCCGEARFIVICSRGGKPAAADEMKFEINLVFCVLIVLTGSSQIRDQSSALHPLLTPAAFLSHPGTSASSNLTVDPGNEFSESTRNPAGRDESSAEATALTETGGAVHSETLTDAVLKTHFSTASPAAPTSQHTDLGTLTPSAAAESLSSAPTVQSTTPRHPATTEGKAPLTSHSLSTVSSQPAHTVHNTSFTASTSTTRPHSESPNTTTTSPGGALNGPLHKEVPPELNVGDEDLKGPRHRSSSPLDPLLAGLLSVFIVTTAIVFVILFLKFRQRNNHPEFHRLQDLPMDDLMEDTPLSRYTY